MRSVAVGLAVAAACAAPVLAFAACHPALAGATPMAEEARALAAEAVRARAPLEALALHDAGVRPAALVLAAALGWLGLALLARLAPAAAQPAGAWGGAAALTALVGHAVASGCARGGIGIPWVLAAGAATTALAALAWPRGGPGVRPAPAAAWRRLAIVGVTLAGALLASPVDAVLAAWSGAPLWPEPWLPLSIAVRSGYGFDWAAPLGASLVAACVGLERLRGRSGWLAESAAYACLLGPSNPAKALVLVAGLRALAAAGGGLGARATVPLGVIAVFVGLPAIIG